MLDKSLILKAVELLKQSKSILVVLPQNPSLDSVAAALAIYLSVKEANQASQIGCSTPMSVAYNRLFGINKIEAKIGSRNLIISFPYAEDSIEKVSYNVEEQKFNLVITSKKGYQPLDSSKVNYSSSGIEAELIVIIGAQKWEDLGNLYIDDQEAFTKSQTINIDARPNNGKFASINLVDSQASSCSELVGKLLQQAGLPAQGDVATNLIAGIESMTNNLQTKTEADTFELIAWLLRQGGQRGHLSSNLPTKDSSPAPIINPFKSKPDSIPTPPLPTDPTKGFTPQAVPPIGVNKDQQPNQISTPSLPSLPSTKTPPIIQETEATDKALEGVSSGGSGEGGVTPSPDWYQPKIYKGKTLS